MADPELAELFREFATLLVITGGDIFRIRAHERAAQTLETTPENVAALARAGNLRELPGIGEGMAKKIAEWYATGAIRELVELRASVNPAVLELMRIPGLGPKKAKMLVDTLGIASVADLETACREQRIRPLKGMGAKSEEKLLAAIGSLRSARERVPLWEARMVAVRVAAHLKEAGGAEEVIPTGSLRRWKETVRDLDFAVVAPESARLMEAVATMPGVVDVVARGETKTSVIFGADRLQIDVRVVPRESFGAALQYFSGSKEHNVRLRERASRAGLTVNEYGVFRLNADGSKGERIAGATEESVYAALGLRWIPPELREDRGEIEGHAEGAVPPRLVERADIRCDLHCHTTWSDGTASIEDMARAAEKLGYACVAITDHSPSAAYAGGLTADRIQRQWEEIEAVQARVGIRILRGSEVDILAGGELDWPDRILESLDWVVASIHQRGKDDRAASTLRLVRALQHPKVNVIGHPSTRRLGQRPPLDIDWEAVFEAAKAHGKALEINAAPERLDLNEVHAARAAALGIPIVIDTDAHAPGMFDNIEYGVMVARRAGLTPSQVLNTRPVAGGRGAQTMS